MAYTRGAAPGRRPPGDPANHAPGGRPRSIGIHSGASGPIPPYIGDTIASQNENVRTVEQQSATVAGTNNPIRIIYGEQVVGADISAVLQNGNFLVIRSTWCEGEIEQVVNFWINGQAAGGVAANHYRGATGQGVDPLLHAAAVASGVSYTDTLPGIAYSVFAIPSGTSSGFPQITAQIKGKKISLASGGAKTYSQNPALCIADLVENATYGMSRQIDWDSVALAAARCDEIVGGEKRNLFSLVIDTPQPVDTWLQIMADYAGAWIVPEGDSYRLIPDSTGVAGSPVAISSVSTTNPVAVGTSAAHGLVDNAIVRVAGITTGTIELNSRAAVVDVIDSTHVELRGIDGSSMTTYTSGGTITQIGVSAYSFGAHNIVARSYVADTASAMQTPTVVEVDYTNTTVFPWRTDTTDPVFVPGVYDIVPSVPFRRTRVSRTGTTRYSEAYRYAIQLINAGQLNDLTARFQGFDVTIKLQVGDLIDVTHPSGPSSKIMRLTSATPTAPGRWDIIATEHDDAKYSNVVVTGPTSPDTTLDSPLSPPTVTGLALAELVQLDASGRYVSKIVVTWNDAGPPAGAYPFVLNYRVDVFNGATLVETATVQRSGNASVQPKYVTGALPENTLYRVVVTTISTLLVESAPAEATITNSGKSAPPSDVKSISAFEIGGEVYIQIDPATDLDLTAHEYRYGPYSGAATDAGSIQAQWDAVRVTGLLDRVATPSIRYTTKAIPAGDWRLYVKGLDSVRTTTLPWGQESLHAAFCDIRVTSDAGAFIAASHDFGEPADYTGMSEYVDGMGNKYWVTNNGDSWDSVFIGTMSTYTDPVATYFTDISHGSSFETEHFDVGAVVSGTWLGTLAYSVLSGSATAYIALSDTDSSYAPHATFTYTDTARWAYLAIIGTGCSLLVTSQGHLNVVVVGRSETGTVTTSATTAATVTLTSRYAKAVSIQVTPASGATGRYATYDNVIVGNDVTNSFDAYAFDTTGTRAAQQCTWLFTGV
jgi:hypothetical protein